MIGAERGGPGYIHTGVHSRGRAGEGQGVTPARHRRVAHSSRNWLPGSLNAGWGLVVDMAENG